MSDVAAPKLIYKWDAALNAMRCLSKRGVDYFVDGEHYLLEAREERSGAQHKAFFASVNSAWKNIPETMEGRWPSPDHLRRWALCKAGFADEDVSIWDSKADAKRAAVMMRKIDAYAVIEVKGNMVRRFTAKSQQVRHMDKKTFKESCESVERIISEVIGTSVRELRNAQDA